jgi:hypothetical protein
MKRASQPGESALLLLDVVDVLVSGNVDYAVIGALAAVIHGAARASMDADVLLSLGLGQAATLAEKLRAAGFATELRSGDMDDPIPALLQVNDSFGNRVDLLIGLRGMDPGAPARCLMVPFQGRSLCFVGREDFIATKVFAGGPLDLHDAANALVAAAGQIDLVLLRRLAAGFGREAVAALERLLAEAGATSGHQSRD